MIVKLGSSSPIFGMNIKNIWVATTQEPSHFLFFWGSTCEFFHLSFHPLVKDLKSLGLNPPVIKRRRRKNFTSPTTSPRNWLVLSWIFPPPQKKSRHPTKGKHPKKRKKERKVANLKGKKLVLPPQSLTGKAPEKFPFPNRKAFFQSPFSTWRIIPV